LKICENTFQQFYQNQHSGRKLNWLHHLSKGDLKTTAFPSKTYTLQSSTYQIALLLQFNSNDSISFETFQATTQLQEAILKSTLQSMVKSKILIASEEDYQNSTNFTLNVNYKKKIQNQK